MRVHRLVPILVLGLLTGPLGAQRPKIRATIEKPVHAYGHYRVQDEVLTNDEGTFYKYVIHIWKDEAPIWDLGPEALTVPKSACGEVDSTPCAEDLPSAHCYDPCVYNGPEFLAFDDKGQKIYIKARSKSGKYAQYFILVGDLATKKVSYLGWIGGPVADGAVSPSGEWLAINLWAEVDLWHIETGQRQVALDETVKRIQSLNDLHTKMRWLSDDQLLIEQEYLNDQTRTQNVYSISTKRFSLYEAK